MQCFSTLWGTGYTSQSQPLFIYSETKGHFLTFQSYKQSKVRRSWVRRIIHNIQREKRKDTGLGWHSRNSRNTGKRRSQWLSRVWEGRRKLGWLNQINICHVIRKGEIHNNRGNHKILIWVYTSEQTGPVFCSRTLRLNTWLLMDTLSWEKT